MSVLSNIFRRNDPPAGDRPVEYRSAANHEIHAALRLVLANGRRPAPEEQVIDFLRFAVMRRIDVGEMRVAAQGGRILFALLPVISPGKSMLMFTPPCPVEPAAQRAAAELIERVLEDFARRGTHLAQVLISPGDEASQLLYSQADFESMAELVYLQVTPRRSAMFPELPEGFAWENYSADTHERFAQTIMGSYRESLDCPGLNGKRSIEDVIEGHKATGQHDPKLWFLLTESHWPRAVVLLSPTVSGETLELVYLGLVPEARGRGIGDLAMRQALAVGWAGRYEQLSLAVDARNAPAMKLYFRHGFQRVSSRLAMMRDLRADYRPTLL